MDENIFKNLSWNAPLDSQNKAINEIASEVNVNLNDLIQPLSKEYWENAARVLSKIGYPKIEEAIPGLFNWLQDLNWPGALIVMELLKSLPKEAIIRHLESAAKEAFSTEDDIWLINLATFLEDFKLQEHDFVSKEIYSALVDSEED
ncbi:MAG: DUF5071 domain-containing protein [Clostridiaceae bacterium]